ncbi:hypothetical protein RNJ44_04506 [Nakaseomyces bracarensis]|uniref:Uncharacterized protein n=1 Tax=Nakaseomyces bracarensis TaxID=273131 RepID=A0ABR4NV35_9SACH
MYKTQGNLNGSFESNINGSISATQFIVRMKMSIKLYKIFLFLKFLFFFFTFSPTEKLS